MLTAIPDQGPAIVVEFPDLTVDAETEPLTFTFSTRIMPGKDWDRLMREHPSSDDTLRYDPDTFVPAALVATVDGWLVTKHGETLELADRPATIDEVRELWEQWPPWARKRLWTPIETAHERGPRLGKLLGRRNERPAPDSPTTNL